MRQWSSWDDMFLRIISWRMGVSSDRWTAELNVMQLWKHLTQHSEISLWCLLWWMMLLCGRYLSHWSRTAAAETLLLVQNVQKQKLLAQSLRYLVSNSLPYALALSTKQQSLSKVLFPPKTIYFLSAFLDSYKQPVCFHIFGLCVCLSV